MSDVLVGLRIGRVDLPARTMLSAQLLGLETRAFLLLTAGSSPVGAGLSSERPKGLPATGVVRLLRLALENGRIERLQVADTHASLTVSRGAARHHLIAFRAAPAGFALLDQEGKVVVATPHEVVRERLASRGSDHADWLLQEAHASATAEANDTAAAWFERGERLLVEWRIDRSRREKQLLGRLVKRHRARLARRIEAVRGDLARAAEAPSLRQRASLLMANAAQIPRGATRAQVIDYTSDPPRELELALDPALSPRALAENLFREARRLDQATTTIQLRLDGAIAELVRWNAFATTLSEVTEEEALRMLVDEAIARKLPGVHELADTGRDGDDAARGATQNARRETSPRVPFRRFRSQHGREILVGRGAKDNDELTLHHARPRDLWLHARDLPGAHVIVRLDKNEACPPDVLADAATLAAHFSDARGEPLVDVTYTPRRYVRKPRNAAPGAVHVEREKVFALRLEPERLARLLASEAT